MDMSESDKILLLQAVRLSDENAKSGRGGPFGAVIAVKGEIAAEGTNLVTSQNDPTAHAEVVAIRRACKKLGRFELKGLTMYSSCEPCPMCLSAIYWARLDRIVFANSRQDAAAIGFDDALLYEEIPKAVQERRMPMLRLELPEAARVFADWLQNPDKIPY